jgi:hypothetical protein
MSLIKTSFLHDIKPLKEIMENIEEHIQSWQGKAFSDAGTLAEDKGSSGLHVPEELPAPLVEEVSAEEIETPPPAESAPREAEKPSPDIKNLSSEMWDNAVRKMDSAASKLSASHALMETSRVDPERGLFALADSIKNMEIIENIFSKIGAGSVWRNRGKKTVRKRH